MELFKFKLSFAIFFWLGFWLLPIAESQRNRYNTYYRQKGSFSNNRIINDLPVIDPYQPEKAPEIPLRLGERRCDNIYHGAILPCLLRPELPPFSYSTTEAYNSEYKKK